jgi:hypothetical protein
MKRGPRYAFSSPSSSEYRGPWMTMLKRAIPTAPPDVALTKTEIALLDYLVKDKGQGSSESKTLPQYLTKLTWLGGYLARQ